MTSLVDLKTLEDSPTVANCRMNREREIRGSNSYAADLGFDVIEFLVDRLGGRESVAWLDLCCGSGRALIQAAEYPWGGLPACPVISDPKTATGQAGSLPHGAARVCLVGVDLVGMFAAVPAGVGNLRLEAASVHDWEPGRAFDLITCVHGLHYVGDKLALIARAASWLEADGLFAGHLDLDNVKFAGERSSHGDRSPALGPLTPGPSPSRGEGSERMQSQMGKERGGKAANARLGKEFKRLGLEYDRRRHVVFCRGRRRIEFPFRYVGADDEAGPNFTHQPAVDSYYEC